MTQVSLTPNAKMALSVLSQFDGGVQINVSQKGCSVATRFTPLAKERDDDLSQAILLCARDCLAQAEYMRAGEPFYATRLNPLIHALQCLPEVGDTLL